MEWNTKVTDLLGCRYPILQGAYQGIGTWAFAAAVANAGGHGTITATNSETPQQLRNDIRSCRDASAGSSGTFGVNLSIGLCPEIDGMLDVCLDERVPIETSVYKPDDFAPRIKASGLPWIHKTARIKDAVHAEHVGADAIIIVGLEGAGMKNPEQLPTLTTTLWGVRTLSVPLIAAGGIGDARGFLAALAMGAEGVTLGTALMATKECPTPDKAKQALVRAAPDSPGLRQRVMMQPVTSDAEDDEETRSAGSFAVGVIDRVSTVKEVIDGIIQGAEEIIARWTG